MVCFFCDIDWERQEVQVRERRQQHMGIRNRDAIITEKNGKLYANDIVIDYRYAKEK